MDEYISREAIVKEIKEEIKACDVKFVEDIQIKKGLKIALKDVKAAKAANVQPVKQWVKLHDKHPDTEGFYLVCDQYGKCEVAEYLPDIKSWFTYKIKGEIRYWIPLPKPPKDGEQND